MYYTGIDLHKFTSYLATVDSSGKIVKQKNIKNVDHNSIQYFDSIPGQHKTTVESTMTWYWLNDLLTSLNIPNSQLIGIAKYQYEQLVEVEELLNCQIIDLEKQLYPFLIPNEDV